EAQFKFTIQDEQGAVVRVLQGARTFHPGEAVEFSIAWDGRDDKGNTLGSGQFTVEGSVELDSPSSTAPSVVLQGGEPGKPVTHIAQRRSMGLELAPIEAAPVAVAPLTTQAVALNSAVGQDPAFPFNHYYGTLHTQTTFSDGGHPNNSTCAASTTHSAGDFTPAQAYAYARNTAHLDFLGITNPTHFSSPPCPSSTAPHTIQPNPT